MPAKWISKWRGHGTLKSIFGNQEWPHQGQNVTVLAILKCLQFKNFSCRANMVCRKEKVLNWRRFRMAKTVTFWPWWQPYNSFCFENVSFFPLNSFRFFLLATQKVYLCVCVRVCWGVGGGPSSADTPGVTGPRVRRWKMVKRKQIHSFENYILEQCWSFLNDMNLFSW